MTLKISRSQVSTQPNPTHQKLKNSDPTQPNPTQPNPWMDPTHDQLCDSYVLVLNIALSCTVFLVIWCWIISSLYRDVEIWVRGHSRSFKLLGYHSKDGAVFYSSSIVTVAVSLTVYEIFNDKVKRDLKHWVRGCSRQGHWKWRRSLDHMRLSIGPPL